MRSAGFYSCAAFSGAALRTRKNRWKVILDNKKPPYRRLIINEDLGWLMGLEPTTTGITILIGDHFLQFINVENFVYFDKNQ